MEKKWYFGVYEPTESFKSIKQMSCVCDENMGVIATTGPADDPESCDQAQLFAASREILKAMNAYFIHHQALNNGQACMCGLCDAAHAAIRKMNGWDNKRE